MKITLVCILAFFNFYSHASEDKNVVKAQLKSATVYKTGAELSHTAQTNLKQGINELVIDNIARNIDINSIQIKTVGEVTLMGVEFNNNYLTSYEKSANIKMLEDSLQKLLTVRENISNQVINNNELIQVLRANREIKGTQTGMSVAELVKLMDYYKIKLQELQELNTSLNEKLKKIDEKRNKVANQIEEDNSRNTSTTGRLVLQLSVALAGKYDFNISYIANDAYWSPYYDVRVDNIKSPLKIITKAKITQTTGIDWKQIKLSLSSSTPAQWGNAPLINAWYLTYVSPATAMQMKLPKPEESADDESVAGSAAPHPALESQNKITLRGYKSVNGNNAPLYVLNGRPIGKDEFSKITPESIKSVNVLKGSAATNIYGSAAADGAILITLKEGLEDYVTLADNTLNLNYDIDIPYDIPTNGKSQTATINSINVSADYKHFAIPKSDKDAYLLAAIAGWSKLNLLPGEANIIFEGTYVGKSFIDPGSTSDTLNLTLGRDKRVVVKREKLIDYSSVKFLGTSKLQKFTYELTVRNTKNEPINIELKDQYPLTTTRDIEVEVIESGGAEVNTDTGVLNWKLTIGAGETQKLRFSYSVKYPKDKQLNL